MTSRNAQFQRLQAFKFAQIVLGVKEASTWPSWSILESFWDKNPDTTRMLSNAMFWWDSNPLRNVTVFRTGSFRPKWIIRMIYGWNDFFLQGILFSHDFGMAVDRTCISLQILVCLAGILWNGCHRERQDVIHKIPKTRCVLIRDLFEFDWFPLINDETGTCQATNSTRALLKGCKYSDPN